jgi:hypothetical protein
MHHIPLAGRAPQDAADRWYADCRAGHRGLPVEPSADGILLPRGDLLGFFADHTGRAAAYYYVLHLGNDGSLSLIAPIGRASGQVGAGVQQCLAVTQLGSSPTPDRFLVLSSAAPLTMLSDLHGLHVPAWLHELQVAGTEMPAPRLTANSLLVMTGESR